MDFPPLPPYFRVETNGHITFGASKTLKSNIVEVAKRALGEIHEPGQEIKAHAPLTAKHIETLQVAFDNRYKNQNIFVKCFLYVFHCRRDWRLKKGLQHLLQEKRQQEHEALGQIKSPPKEIESIEPETLTQTVSTLSTALSNTHVDSNERLRVRALLAEWLTAACPPDIRKSPCAQSFFQHIRESKSEDSEQIRKECETGMERLKRASLLMQNINEKISSISSLKETLEREMEHFSPREQWSSLFQPLEDSLTQVKMQKDELLKATQANAFDSQANALERKLNELDSVFQTVRTQLFVKLQEILQQGQTSSEALLQLFPGDSELHMLHSQYDEAKSAYDKAKPETKFQKARVWSTHRSSYFHKLRESLATLPFERLPTALQALVHESAETGFREVLEQRMHTLEMQAEEYRSAFSSLAESLPESGDPGSREALVRERQTILQEIATFQSSISPGADFQALEAGKKDLTERRDALLQNIGAARVLAAKIQDAEADLSSHTLDNLDQSKTFQLLQHPRLSPKELLSIQNMLTAWFRGQLQTVPESMRSCRFAHTLLATVQTINGTNREPILATLREGMRLLHIASEKVAHAEQAKHMTEKTKATLQKAAQDLSIESPIDLDPLDTDMRLLESKRRELDQAEDARQLQEKINGLEREMKELATSTQTTTNALLEKASALFLKMQSDVRAPSLTPDSVFLPEQNALLSDLEHARASIALSSDFSTLKSQKDRLLERCALFLNKLKTHDSLIDQTRVAKNDLANRTMETIDQWTGLELLANPDLEERKKQELRASLSSWLQQHCSPFNDCVKNSAFAQSLVVLLKNYNGQNKGALLSHIHQGYALLQQAQDRSAEAKRFIVHAKQEQAQLVERAQRLNISLPLFQDLDQKMTELEESLKAAAPSDFAEQSNRLLLTCRNLIKQDDQQAIAALKNALQERYADNEELFASLDTEDPSFQTVHAAKILLDEQRIALEHSSSLSIEVRAEALKQSKEAYDHALQACYEAQNSRLQEEMNGLLTHAREISRHSPGQAVPQALEQAGLRFSQKLLRGDKQEILHNAKGTFNEWLSSTFLPGSIKPIFAQATIQGLCEAKKEDIDLLARQLELGLQQRPEPDHALLTNLALVIANCNSRHPILETFKPRFQAWPHASPLPPNEQQLLATIQEQQGLLENSWVGGMRASEVKGHIANQLGAIQGIIRFLKQPDDQTSLQGRAEALVRSQLLKDLNIPIPIEKFLPSSHTPRDVLPSPREPQKALTYAEFLEYDEPRLKERLPILWARLHNDTRTFLTFFQAVQRAILPMAAASYEKCMSDIDTLASATAEPVTIAQADLAPIQAACSQIEGSLENYTSYSESARQSLRGRVHHDLDQLLQQTGYASQTSNNLDALETYVQENGCLPRALQHVLASNGEAMELLSRLLYYSMSLRETHQHLPIATLSDFAWLFACDTTLENASRCFLLMKALKEDAKYKGCVCTKQQAEWGTQVAHLLIGEPTKPIYGSGGSGKTVAVKFFLSFLPKCGIGQEGKQILMLSPFADRDKEAPIHSRLLSDFSGRITLDINFDPEKALVIIDEAHLLQPDFDLVLRQSGKTKRMDFLKMTATPITAPFPALARNQAVFESFTREQALCQERLAALETQENEHVQQLRDLFREEIRQQFLSLAPTVAPLQKKPTLSSTNIQDCYMCLFQGQTKLSLEKALWGFLGGGRRSSSFLDQMTPLPIKEECVRIFKLYAESLGFTPPRVGMGPFVPHFEAAFQEWLQKGSEREEETPRLPPRTSRTAPRNTPRIPPPAFSQDARTVKGRIDDLLLQKEALQSAAAHIQRHLDRYQHEIEIIRERDDRIQYQETALLRTACLDSMWVEQQPEQEIEEPGSWDAIASHVARSFPVVSRLQLLLPFLSLHESRLHTLHASLQQQYPSKRIHLVFHDSHSTTPLLGKNCMRHPDGTVDVLDPSWRQGEDDIVIMVYDKTNKQGGDFGSLSRNPDTPEIRQPHVEQITFLTLKERGQQPLDHLTESDLYQTLRRRRGSDMGEPKRRVVSPFSQEQLRAHVMQKQKQFEKQWALRDATERVANALFPVRAPTVPPPPIQPSRVPRLALSRMASSLPPDMEPLLAQIERLRGERIGFARLQPPKEAVRIKIDRFRSNPLPEDLTELQQADFWEIYSHLLEAEKIMAWAEHYGT